MSSEKRWRLVVPIFFALPGIALVLLGFSGVFSFGGKDFLGLILAAALTLAGLVWILVVMGIRWLMSTREGGD